MSFIQSLILGLTQAVTEFLPVSSDGHLNLAQKIFGLEPSLSLDIFLHAATFISVIWFFRKNTKYFFDHLPFIIVGSLPAIIVGLFFKNNVETIFSNPKLLPLFFLITTLFLLATKFLAPRNHKLTIISSLVIGTFQALAILPGVSRSASTMFSGLLLGLSPLNAFNFSFSLFIPVSLGAIILGIVDLDVLSLISPLNLLVFFLTVILGYASLSLLKGFMTNKKLWVFGIYTLILSLITFLAF